jgi:hypothetical protein
VNDIIDATLGLPERSSIAPSGKLDRWFGEFAKGWENMVIGNSQQLDIWMTTYLIEVL